MHPSLRLADLRFYQDLDVLFAAVLHVHAEACAQLRTLIVKADEPLRVTVDVAVPNLELDCHECVKVRYRVASSFAPLGCWT